MPVIKLQINLVKLCEKELEKDPNAKAVKALEILDDEETKVLSIDITLDEPRKRIAEI